jgi:hypothetical protein
MKKLHELLILLLLGVTIAVAPIACGSDNGNNDGAADHMTPS